MGFAERYLKSRTVLTPEEWELHDKVDRPIRTKFAEREIRKLMMGQRLSTDELRDILNKIDCEEVHDD